MKNLLSLILPKQLSHSDKKDNSWNTDSLAEMAKTVFMRMQDAWMNRDIERVKDILSPGLYLRYKQKMEYMKHKGEKNIMTDISVSNISIVSTEDYINDSKDSFIAIIDGEMIDFTISEETNEVINNRKDEKTSFSDGFHFIKTERGWVLNYIENDVCASYFWNSPGLIEAC